jgi:hypothetical protein
MPRKRMGEWTYNPTILNLGIKMEVCNQFQASPALPTRKVTPASIVLVGWVGHTPSMDVTENRESTRDSSVVKSVA